MKRKRQVQEVSNSHKQVHVITVMMVYMFTLCPCLQGMLTGMRMMTICILVDAYYVNLYIIHWLPMCLMAVCIIIQGMPMRMLTVCIFLQGMPMRMMTALQVIATMRF